MTILTDLPIELLQVICPFSEAILFWKCGSKRLMSKLANGITKVSLQDYRPMTTSRFPRCLHSFVKLKDLSIRRDIYRLEEPDDLGNALRRLSPTLERLSLCFSGAEACFAEYGPIDDLFNETDPSYEYSKPHRHIWSIKDTFPRLTTLVLEDSSLEKTSWTSCDFDELPSQLTHLQLASQYPIECLSDYDHFPKGLLTLDFVVQRNNVIWTPEYCAALPRSLTSLGTCSAARSIEVDKLPYLPSSLTGLAVILPAPHSLPPFDPSAALPWARFDLTSLYIAGYESASANELQEDRYFAQDWLKMLPRSLTRLELPDVDGWSSFAGVLRIGDMKYLPAGLTDLTLANISLDDHTEVVTELKELRRLLVEGQIKDTRVVSLLPRSITFLYFYPRRVFNADDHVMSDLPPSLTYLHWRRHFRRSLHAPPSDRPLIPAPHLPALQLMLPPSPSVFPRFLLSLTITSPAVWDNHPISLLPRTLLSLHLNEALITENAFSLLPPGLTELQMASVAMANDYFALRHFSLENETLDPENTETDDTWDLTHLVDVSTIREIRDGLEVDLKVKTPRRVKRHVTLSKLPHGLLYLDITQELHYSASLVATLPPNLTYLRLPYLDASHPGEVHLLPKKLKTLGTAMIGSGFTDADIDALPKTITSLDLDIKDKSLMSKDLDVFLPPNLHLYDLSQLSKAQHARYRRSVNTLISSPDPRVIARFANV